MLVFGWNFSWCLVEILKIKCDVICVWTCDMTSRGYFGKMNSTLGSVAPLAMFSDKTTSLLWEITWKRMTKISPLTSWRFIRQRAETGREQAILGMWGLNPDQHVTGIKLLRKPWTLTEVQRIARFSLTGRVSYIETGYLAGLIIFAAILQADCSPLSALFNRN